MSVKEYVTKHWEEEMKKHPAHDQPIICGTIAVFLLAIAAYFGFFSPIASKMTNNVVTGLFAIPGFLALIIGLIIEWANDQDIEERLQRAYYKEQQATQ